MKYMLLIYFTEKADLSESERQDCYKKSVAANPLHPATMARSVRIRDGKRLVTDGPFAETHEQLGGYLLIEAKNSEEAIDVATRIPMARNGTVEVRPVIEFP